MDLTLQSLGTRELYERFVAPTYARFNLEIVRGEGTRVWDPNGKSYLDFGAGIAVCSLGHSHPRLSEAIAHQSATLIHTSNLYYTREQGVLARRLVNCVGHHGKIFFCNSGAEANEALYKLARKFGNDTAPPPPRHTVGELVATDRHRCEIITCEGSFHGRTLAGVAATGQAKVKRGFDPQVQGFRHVPFNDAPALLAAITPATAAVLIEPIQGESGVWPAHRAYLRTVRSVCDDHDLLLMFDEVQCGLGRTGDWCAWKTIAGDEIVPDAISWAKGIAGGFPMGALWIRDREVTLSDDSRSSLADTLGPGSHGTTFGGTPLACAAAGAVLDVIEEEKLLENAKAMGEYALKRLQQLQSPFVREVRGVGLMIGIQLKDDAVAQSSLLARNERTPVLNFIDLLHEEGLLSVPSGTHALRWLLPLNVTRAEIEEAIDILRRVFQKLA